MGRANCEAADVVGHPPALTIGDVGQRDKRRAAADRVTLLHGVADGVDVGITRSAILVDGDPSAWAKGKARQLGKLGVRAHADGPDHERSGDLATVGKHNAALAHFGYRDPRLDANAAADELGGNQNGQFGIERRQDLCSRFDDRHGDPAVSQVLGRLESHESGPDDHAGSRLIRHVVCQPLCVLDRS